MLRHTVRLKRFAPLLFMVLGATAIACPWASPDARPVTVARAYVPRLDGSFWQTTNNPDLGPLTGAQQTPVDFAIWKAKDGTWQIEECIRATNEPGKTRLFFRWQAANITDTSWAPMGISMRADPAVGETPGGLQAPHVVEPSVAGDGRFHMFYGDWEHISHATSVDGKSFARELTAAGTSGVFGEGTGANTRDPMVLSTKGQFIAYYAANPGDQCAVYARTSADLRAWSAPSRVAFGGIAGKGPYSAECPFVIEKEGYFYLFRTQSYGPPITRVYRSRDPLDFGIDDDRFLIAELPIAAPELVLEDGQWYVASVLFSAGGTGIARLAWDPL